MIDKNANNIERTISLGIKQEILVSTFTLIN